MKWVLGDNPAEYDTDKAAALLQQIVDESVVLLQPEHWRVEVLSVVARLAPERFASMWKLFETVKVRRIETKQVLERGVLLSKQLKHHLFDTLYHAIAIEHGATLITADDSYFVKAFRLGNIKLLVNLPLPPI